MPGLEDLYREIILDHYKRPRNKGELPPPAHRTDGVNPSCGDEIAVYLVVDGTGPDAIVTDISIGGQGCSISQASASMMTAAVKGKSVTQARQMITAVKAMVGVREAGRTEAHDDDHGDHTDATPQPEVKLGDLEALRGVVKFPVRIKCATLAWNTMDQGLTAAASGVPPDPDA
jgi:nitrogen fixation protein NifU and related proteins